MLVLQSDNYTFWVREDKETWEDSVDIHIGNPRGRPKPCIVLSVYDEEIILQELTYYSTCSAPDKQLERGSGTVEMTMAALKATMRRYRSPTKVIFTDKRRGNVPIPEVRALATGATWYQAHFGAVPSDASTRHVLARYLAIRTRPAARYGIEEGAPGTTVAEYVASKRWTKGSVAPALATFGRSEDEMLALRERLRLPMLTGSTWEVPRATVEAYPVAARYVSRAAQAGGGGGGGSGDDAMRRSPCSRPYRPRIQSSNSGTVMK